MIACLDDSEPVDDLAERLELSLVLWAVFTWMSA